MADWFRTLAPYSPPDIKPILKRREARKADNDAAWEIADRVDVDSFDCACECVDELCGERFTVKANDFRETRRRRLLAMALYHPDAKLERVWEIHDGWVDVLAPNPASGTLDVETLKHHVESVRSELEAERTELAAITGRIATSLVTAALVISLAASVLPEDLGRTQLLLVIIGLGLFVPIAWIALHRPEDIEESLVPTGESLSAALKQHEKNPRETIGRSPLLMGSYEQWNRIERVTDSASGLMFTHLLLPEGDYLVAEVNLLARRLADVTQRTKRARSVLGQVRWLLSLLVVYLIVMVAFLRLQ